MARFRSILLLFLLLCWSPRPTFGQSIVVRSVNVVDPRTGSVAPDRTVLVTGDRITGVEAADSVAVPEGARVVEGTGRYLIPGLWDMHVHLDDPELWPRHVSRAEKERVLAQLVAHGVTGVRDMGSGLNQIQAWRARWRLDSLVAPRIVTPGPIVGGALPSSQIDLGGRSEWDVRHLVRRLARRPGVDFIKVYSLTPRTAYFRLADEASRIGMEFSGHLPFSISMEEALEAGQRTVEHGDGLVYRCTPDAERLHRRIVAARDRDPTDPEVAVLGRVFQGFAPEVMKRFDPTYCRALLHRIAEAPVWLTPTNVVFKGLWLSTDTTYRDPRRGTLPEVFVRHWREARSPPPRAAEQQRAALESRLQLTSALHQAGVSLLAGSDMAALPYTYPGSSLHDELALFVEAGLSPTEALRTATVEPARYLGRSYEIGAVAPGMLADLVLLRGNPLEDIENLRKVEAVVANGRLLQGDRLEAFRRGER